jgi:A-factor biosynthesis hotdog domain
MNLLERSQTHPLNRSSTLARELVHRTALAEVLLTDVQRGPGREHAFRAAAQWARSHPTFDRAGDGRHNPLLVAETLRELGICIPLQFYGVSADSHFLIEELRFAIQPEAEPRARYGGSDITCEVQAEPLQASRGHKPADKHGDPPEPGRHERHDQAGPSAHPNGGDRPGRSTGPERLRLTARYLAEGRKFAHADGIARFLSPAAYAAVRSRRATDRSVQYRGHRRGQRPAAGLPEQVGELVPAHLDPLAEVVGEHDPALRLGGRIDGQRRATAVAVPAESGDWDESIVCVHDCHLSSSYAYPAGEIDMQLKGARPAHESAARELRRGLRGRRFLEHLGRAGQGGPGPARLAHPGAALVPAARSAGRRIGAVQAVEVQIQIEGETGVGSQPPGPLLFSHGTTLRPICRLGTNPVKPIVDVCYPDISISGRPGYPPTAQPPGTANRALVSCTIRLLSASAPDRCCWIGMKPVNGSDW